MRLPSETLAFCSRYIEDFNPDCIVHAHDGPEDDEIFIFLCGVEVQGKEKAESVNEKALEKMVWHVLNNCEEIEPYVK